MSDSNQENIFNLSNLIGFVSKNKIALSIIGVVAFIVSVIVCLSIPPKFKSTVILFPTSSGSVSQALITESQQKKEILNFGEEEEVEQLMQILLSSEIRNRIIEKYDLFRHYRINKDSKYANSQLYKKYESNVKISRTEYMSIKIEVLDESPDTAALIANDVAALVDSLYAKIQRERATKAFQIVEREFLAQKDKIKSIEDSLFALSKLGVIDVKSQSEMYSEQHAIAIASGNERARIEIEKKLDILATYGSSQSILKEQMFEEVKQLSVIEAKYREARIDMEQDLPNTYIVSPAEVADRKFYPIYWLTVSVSVLSTLLFSIVLLLLFDKYIKKKSQFVFKSELQELISKFEIPKYEVMESYFKTKSIFSLIFKWKWHLIIIMVVAGALGALFSSSWFIKPKYQSTAVVYPANITPLSEESESEQMLELFQSEDIMFRIIEVFDLYEHYGVSKESNNHLWKISKYYNGNVSIQKTPNEAIVITVSDIDPQMASDIVDSIISFYNIKVLQLNTEKSQEIVTIYKREYEKKLKEIDSLSNVLKTYSTKYGMIDMTAQVEKYTEAIANGRSLDESRKVLSNWQEYGAEFHKNDSLFYYALSDMHTAKTTYEGALRDSEKIQTYAHVVTKPYPADKKSYPVRWMIVLFSVVGSFLAGAIIISLIEGAKKTK